MKKANDLLIKKIVEELKGHYFTQVLKIPAEKNGLRAIVNFQAMNEDIKKCGTVYINQKFKGAKINITIMKKDSSEQSVIEEQEFDQKMVELIKKI